MTYFAYLYCSYKSYGSVDFKFNNIPTVPFKTYYWNLLKRLFGGSIHFHGKKLLLQIFASHRKSYDEFYFCME